MSDIVVNLPITKQSWWNETTGAIQEADDPEIKKQRIEDRKVLIRSWLTQKLQVRVAYIRNPAHPVRKRLEIALTIHEALANCFKAEEATSFEDMNDRVLFYTLGKDDSRETALQALFGVEYTLEISRQMVAELTKEVQQAPEVAQS